MGQPIFQFNYYVVYADGHKAVRKTDYRTQLCYSCEDWNKRCDGTTGALSGDCRLADPGVWGNYGADCAPKERAPQVFTDSGMCYVPHGSSHKDVCTKLERAAGTPELFENWEYA